MLLIMIHPNQTSVTATNTRIKRLMQPSTRSLKRSITYEEEENDDDNEATMPRKKVNTIMPTITQVTQSTSKNDMRNEQEKGKNMEDGGENVGRVETLSIERTISAAAASSSKCDVEGDKNVEAGREMEQEEAMAIDK
jgi:hypothetical protein